MNKRWLWTHLNIPLSLATLAALVLHRYWKAGGFWINVAAGFIANIIAINYIDKVIARHTQFEWQGATELIAKRLLYLTNGTITGIRTASRISVHKLSMDSLDLDDKAAYFKLCEREIEPIIESSVLKLDQNGWKQLMQALEEAQRELEDFLSLFGHKLPATLFKEVLALQDEIRSVLRQYSVFPDFLGVPDAQLPVTKHKDQVWLKNHTANGLATKVSAILTHVRNLGLAGIKLGEGA
jgi:hypothetical protein